MGLLKYYADERKRHADVQAVTLTFVQCKDLINILCDHFGLARITVLLRSGGRSSHYKPWDAGSRSGPDRRPAGPAIKMLPSMLQARTTCHEFAHYAHHMEYKKNSKVGRQVHGHEHRQWMDKTVEFAKMTMLYQQAQLLCRKNRIDMLKAAAEHVADTVDAAMQIEQRMAAEPALVTVDPVVAAFLALPAILRCPKCNTDKPKIEFGVRVMSRDAVTKLPIKIARQSYCRSCR